MPPPYVRHVFVCQNERAADDPRGCCSAKASGAVLEAFKRELKARDLARVVRTNKAGCLDACAHGVSVVVYPDAIWYGGVTEADVPEIVRSHLVDGVPVSRLVFARGPASPGPLGAVTSRGPSGG